jgi:ribosome maturation factor RimP
VYYYRFLQGVGRSLVGSVRAHFLFWNELKSRMDKLQIAEKVREIAAQVAEKQSVELVHVETVGTPKNPTVRVFIDKPGGVTIDDCSDTSRALEKILDAEDFIPTAYTLEVSSPGLDRELYSLQDFAKFAGHPAKVRTHQPIGGQRNFRGRIKAVEAEQIVFEDKTSGEVRFGFDSVAKANLEVDLEEELKNAKLKMQDAE